MPVTIFNEKHFRATIRVTNRRVVFHEHGNLALFTKLPDCLPPYRTVSGDCSVGRLPIDIFPFCREWLITKAPAAL